MSSSTPPTPRVSVLLVARNAGRYLDEAIASVLTQSFRHFELLLVDDGSTDGTLRRSSRWRRRDPRVRILRAPQRGLTRSLQWSWPQTRGALIARMDADDVCEPTRLERQVAFLDAHPDVVCVGTRVTIIEPHGVPIGRSDQPLEAPAIEAGLLRGIGWSLVHPTAVIRREALISVGGYDTRLEVSQDLDLWLRLSERGPLANLPELLLRFRVHPDSVTARRFEDQRRVKGRIVRAAWARRGLAPPDTRDFPVRPRLHRTDELAAWCRAAVQAGRRDVALRHAATLLREAPRDLTSWQLLGAALRRAAAP